VLYSIVRLAILLIVFLYPFIMAIRKRNVKVLKILIIIICVFCIILWNLPIENLVTSFSSPEEIFYYSHNGTITNVVNGKDSCMIFYTTEKNKNSFFFARKDNGKYKLSHYLESQKTATYIGEYGNWMIYRFGATKDYYVFASPFDINSSIKVFHNKMEIPITMKQISSESHTKVFFLYDYSDEFEFMIGTEIIEFDE